VLQRRSEATDITLVRPNDRQRIPTTRDAIEHAIAEGPVFDQLNI
jgi:hypothetical protein